VGGVKPTPGPLHLYPNRTMNWDDTGSEFAKKRRNNGERMAPNYQATFDKVAIATGALFRNAPRLLISNSFLVPPPATPAMREMP
jgi:hypothetical protein